MDLNQLMLDFFTHDDISELTRDAGEAMGCPIIVVNNAFRVEAFYAPQEFDDPLFTSMTSAGQLNYELIALAERGRRDGGVELTSVEGSEHKGRIFDLTHQGVSMGYMVCVDYQGRLQAVPERELLILQAVLAKQLLFKYHRDQIVTNDGQAVLASLLDGQYESETAFQLQASSTFLRSFRPERLAVLDIEEYAGLGLTGDPLQQDLLELFPQGHPFVYEKRVLLFLSLRDIDKLHSLSQRLRLWGVISFPIKRLFTLRASYDSALQILEYTSVKGGARVAVADDYRDFLLLRRLSSGESLMDPRIEKLMNHDLAHGTEYVRTLYYYLSCHRSVKTACQKLSAHRNTVLYRIQRLREDLDIDTDDPDSSLTLLLSAAQALFTIAPEEFIG